MDLLCPHCNRRKVQPDRRGLCIVCGSSPPIRGQYAKGRSGNKSRMTQPRDRDGKFKARREPWRPMPFPAPTHAPPGSDEKIAVLAERFRRRLQLFHPQDARGRSSP